jgi:hypothetical protein
MKAKSRNGVRKAIPSDPAWEAAKAACRNLDHNDAVQESFFLQIEKRDIVNT